MLMATEDSLHPFVFFIFFVHCLFGGKYLKEQIVYYVKLK